MQRAARASRTSRFARGFTLTELVVTLALAGVLAMMAVPNLRTFFQNNRLSGASNDLLRSFQIARSEAIKRQQNIVVCASANPTAGSATCSYGAFNGWIVFQDTNGNWQADAAEPVIERHEALDPTLTVRTDNNGIESYSQTGFANPTGVKTPSRNVVVCDVRGLTLVSGSSTGRALIISPTGRARVSRDDTEVRNALSATGGSCP